VYLLRARLHLDGNSVSISLNSAADGFKWSGTNSATVGVGAGVSGYDGNTQLVFPGHCRASLHACVSDPCGDSLLGHFTP
jgi:hypothetical protein